ncbi:MAG: hypothetical protein IJI07_03385 [Flexilinea sp.]|nr:hypothetical protein [Flexilinea sp.]
MAESPLFMLLDIDGVLLEAHGYRDACVDTINDLLCQMGQPGLSVDRSLTDAFEAGGIGAEWDMVPLTLAAFTDWYCSRTGIRFPDDAFPPDCSTVRMYDNDAFREMLKGMVSAYCGLLDPKLNVIDAIRMAYENGKANGLETLLGMPLWKRYFTNTLDPESSPYFRHLMCRLIGSSEFESFYGMPAPVRCEAYLVTRDLPLVSEHWRLLLPELSGKEAFPVVMTYRPTRLPVTNGNNKALYYVNTPDGECALRLLGWTDGRIPMIGSGSLCYIEDKYGVRREYYVKPHPFHALASMLRAVCDEMTALETARLLCELDPVKDPNPAAEILSPGRKIRLSVFEDSVTGIQSMKNAADVLRSWGYEVEEVICGIMTTEEKNRKLIGTGAVLYPNVNAAFDAVLAECERKQS